MSIAIVRVTDKICGEIFFSTQNTNQLGQKFFALSVCCPKCGRKISGLLDDEIIEELKPKQKQ